MNIVCRVRLRSGREERFRIELLPGAEEHVETRLKQFMKQPDILLQTDDEIIMFPASAIECISVEAPRSVFHRPVLLGVNQAVRLSQ